jgi:hypothetical protein
LLPRIALSRALASAARERADRLAERQRVERLHHPALELGGAEHRQGRIGIERPVEAGLVAEPRDEAGRAVTDHDQVGPGAADQLDLAVQLHHVVTAVDSTEVAEEHQHDRAVTP